MTSYRSAAPLAQKASFSQDISTLENYSDFENYLDFENNVSEQYCLPRETTKKTSDNTPQNVSKTMNNVAKEMQKQNSPSSKSNIKDEDMFFLPEAVHHAPDIEDLNSKAFGPARFTRAAHFIREEGGHDLNASFVIEKKGKLIGSLRMTPIKIGLVEGMLLGPLVIEKTHEGEGLGGKLIALALDNAKKMQCPLVLLVGDEPYYGRFGFKIVPYGQMQMPAPVNPNRLLVLEVIEGAGASAIGKVRHKDAIK